MSIHLEIGGVDYSDYIYDLDLEPSGPGKIGTGTLRLTVPGSTITDRMTVKVWRVDGSGDLVRRYFGGYVGGAGTGRLSVTPTKTWDIPLQDYALAGKRLVADVDLVTDSGTVLSAGTFAAQVADAVLRWQEMNGTPSVYIDASSKVVNLTGATVLPAIPGLNGKSLDFVLQQICNNARVVTPALRPRWRWGLDDTFGSGAVFGPPVLWVYNAADVTSTVAHFDDAVNNIIIGTYKRTTQSPALVNRRQSVYGDPPAVVTSLGTGSHSTYPFDLAGDGYWSDEALEDKDSTDSTKAQAVLDRNRQATEYPRETIELSSRVWAEPGETVLVTWAGDGLSAVGYRVAGVRLTFWKSDADTPICAYTLGQVPREVGISDGDDIGNPPVVGDHIRPGPPTALAGVSTYDGATHRAVITGTFHSPADSDYEYSELRYHQRLNAGAWGDWRAITPLPGAPDTDQAYTIPNLEPSYSGNAWETEIFPQAYDHNHNGSWFGTAIIVANASIDNPNPPTGLAYTTVYKGNGVSAATITYGAGAQPPTRDHYTAELTAPNGRTYVYTIPGTVTTYTFKDLSPGLVYSLSMVAVTPYGDPSGTPATLSITAAPATVPGPDPVWHPGEKDPDTADTLALIGYKRGTAVGTHVTASVQTAVVYNGTDALKWTATSGGSGDTDPVQTRFTKEITPGATLTARFREGDSTNTTGTLRLTVSYYTKAGTLVGSAVDVYSAAPSTTAGGVTHEVQWIAPTTSTITRVGWELKYVTAGTANAVYSTEAQLTQSMGVVDTYFAADATTPLYFYDPGVPGIPRGDIRVTAPSPGGRGRISWTADRDSSLDPDPEADTYTTFKDTLGNTIESGDDGWNFATVGTFIFNGHQGTLGSSPTLVASGGAGSSPTLSLNTGATDTAGELTVLTGTGCTAGARVVDIHWATAYAVKPVVTLTPRNEAAALLPLAPSTVVWADRDSSTGAICYIWVSTSRPLDDNTEYQWAYTVIGQPN